MKGMTMISSTDAVNPLPNTVTNPPLREDRPVPKYVYRGTKREGVSNVFEKGFRAEHPFKDLDNTGKKFDMELYVWHPGRSGSEGNNHWVSTSKSKDVARHFAEGKWVFKIYGEDAKGVVDVNSEFKMKPNEYEQEFAWRNGIPGERIIKAKHREKKIISYNEKCIFKDDNPSDSDKEYKEKKLKDPDEGCRCMIF
jgi:hypothetical protein